METENTNNDSKKFNLKKIDNSAEGIMDKRIAKLEKDSKLTYDILSKLEYELKDSLNNPLKNHGIRLDAIKDLMDHIKKYEDQLKQREIKLLEINEEILGSGDENNKKKSLVSRISNLEENLTKLYEINVKKQDALLKKIEGLLPGATSIGLAKSYRDQKQSYNMPILIWSIIFGATMLAMISSSIYILRDVTNFSEALMGFASRLPFYVPSIWLGVFASKQVSQNRRLQQEYAHKEVLATSYEGYKREFDKLDEYGQGTELLKVLASVMIESAKFNPSETLENKSHNDGPPIFKDLLNRNKKED